MVGLFRKSELFAFYMAWVYSIFHGVVLQCLLLMMEMEFLDKLHYQCFMDIS